MSDNELDELLSQLKDTCKKNRHNSSNEAHLHTILKKIDVFINRRQMKLMNHQKRLDDLQRDLLFSEQESSTNRVALQKKVIEVDQLHMMLNKAEQVTQNIMTKYDNDVQKLTKQLSNVQQEYERLQIMHKNNQNNRSNNTALTEITHLRELNKMLEIDNQRLYNEIDQLKQTCQHQESILPEKLIHPLPSSNPQSLSNQTIFELKIKTLENNIDFYKQRSEQQKIEIDRLTKELKIEYKQHQNELDTCRTNILSDEIDKLRLSLNNSEQQCHLLRLELQRTQAEKEILKVRLMTESSTTEFNREIENNDYEKFIRNELEVNIDQANKLINYWKSHQQTLEEKIRQLTNEIHQLKKDKKTNHENDLSGHIYQYNENILQAKREMNKLQMEITDKNTIIYNLYKKIECLEQALTISKQRMNAQLNEIQELRSRTSKSIPIFTDGLSTDDEGQIRQSIDCNKNLCTSSPIKSADIHKYFRHFDGDSSSSISNLRQNRELLPSDHRNLLSR